MQPQQAVPPPLLQSCLLAQPLNRNSYLRTYVAAQAPSLSAVTHAPTLGSGACASCTSFSPPMCRPGKARRRGLQQELRRPLGQRVLQQLQQRRPERCTLSARHLSDRSMAAQQDRGQCRLGPLWPRRQQARRRRR